MVKKGLRCGPQGGKNMIYLDNAATSFPKPPEVGQAMAGVMEKIGGNPGRAGHAGALAGGRIIEKCRELAAEYAGIDQPERVIFCLNCTDALNIAIRGMLHQGDEVLVSHGEHNAVMRPLMGYHDQGKIRVNMLPPDARGLLSPDMVRQSITGKTALMVLCHASNVTGVIQPAKEIARACHEKGIPLLLDAAQTAGTEDIASVHADMIAMPGHKGLLGPMGTGLLCLGNHMLPRPFREGGTGSASESMRQPAMLPDRLESGTANLPGIAGLCQGLKFVLRHRGAIAEYEHALAGRLRLGLKNIDGVQVYGAEDAPRVGVVSFNVGRMDSGEVADLLSSQRIAVRGGLHCAPAMHAYLGTEGSVRASVGPYNTEEEIDRFLQAVQHIAGK
ncbi:MAG: aminotransferase class V-fold PLP-dependent enzyme [Clostridiales bacterium]|nr:aminotransferase class V-fold PLP-dependent enzyme [Clostridiales bacterium]